MKKRKPTPNQVLRNTVDSLKAQLERKEQALDELVDVLWPLLRDRVQELIDDAVSNLDVRVW